jgi:hypothetical protein
MTLWTRICMVCVLLSFGGCRPSSVRTCRVQVEGLRSRVSKIEWSRLDLSPSFPYGLVPKGTGRLIPWNVHATAGVDGTAVEVQKNQHPPGAELRDWLAVEGRRYAILRPNRPLDRPIYLMATAGTKLSFLRVVVEALEPFAVVRLAVRPSVSEQPAWYPSEERRSLFGEVARRGPYDLAYYERSQQVLLSAAAGCPKAVELVNLPGLVGSRRIPLLADIFEGCRCAGDMHTLAALYWWMTFDWSRPARWLPWDPAVAAQLGEDATYEQLVRALIAREIAPVP